MDAANLGRTRLYSIEVAVTCAHCGQPMFVTRPPKPGEHCVPFVKCPDCDRVSRVVVTMQKEDV